MSTKPDLTALVELTTTTQALLTQFLSTLSPPSAGSSAPSPTDQQPNIDALSLLKDASSLLKAHTTKLSLLLLNKPFTATAITRVLREITNTVIPAMMSGHQIVAVRSSAHTAPRIVEAEVRGRVRRVVSAVQEEVAETRAMAEEELQREGTGAQKPKRDALASTGLVWEACDALAELQSMGVVGLVVKKAEQWRATLLDAVEELKEWSEEEGEDDDEEDAGVGSDDEDSMDEMFGGGSDKKLPKDDKELREQLEKVLKKVKTVAVLYQALVKRRLKAYSVSAASEDKSQTEKLDQLLDILSSIPDQIDEVASAFYDLDGEEAKKVFADCCGNARKAADLVKQNWEGKDDEFTAWSAKFVEAMST
ncbi:uncharacterized protein K452DRAFT_265377 [Aplosporella prunicola CBS 121167]|uniref:Cyclin-D1-binding protein 1-like N-terminal domain-containing protein n=1 Tax=Aplosporella prunicola CBS 121167 TaxID=1176127 RepID=A0A6A6BQQ7_9PEZI|nr:uncharacterized protein K452DRAFT_265377 [Aplosporella prunicola CBS 121167]KAF2144921.1 hypothetical protein K452DRAFT_265377 [Aplosporella prunicola CBS 121167]